MKKSKDLMCYLCVAVLLIILACNVALGEEVIELSLPENMPENYLRYYWIGGAETNGVTFVIENAKLDGNSLKVNVLQLPNDDYTSLIDNQVEYQPNDRDFAREKEEALQYGKKLLGTLCDILSITDEKGNNLRQEYKISTERNAALLACEFTIYLPLKNEIQYVNIDFVFGVNEDLSSRFSMSDSMFITIPLLESF